MITIAIIGGGITGLTAAYTLQKRISSGDLEAEVVLIEGQQELGGKIRSLRQRGYIMETGADSIVSRKARLMPILDELGLTEDVVYNATGKSYLYIDRELKPIPEDTLFGIPLSIESLARSELISAEGKVAALKDLYTPNETFTKHDSVGSFLTCFLGEELVKRQIAPVLSGVYSGNLNELTLASTMPYLLDYKNEYGSIIRGLEANKDKFISSGGGKFLSFARGLSQLVERMAERIPDVRVLKGTSVERLTRSGDRYELTLTDGELLAADRVVLAVLHTDAARLLDDRALDEAFARMTTGSLISVYLGYEVSDSILPQDGTGFIVAGDSDLRCSACTWTSRKWAQTSAERRLLMRLFYKSAGPDYAELARLSEEQLLQVARQDIERSLGIREEPVVHAVTRWEEAMPVYHIRHQELVQQLEDAMRDRYPNVVLAGCSYHGVGIPDCMLSGERAANIASGLA